MPTRPTQVIIAWCTAVLALCLVVGCGTPQPRRIPYTGGDAASIQKAFAECEYEAAKAAAGITDSGVKVLTEMRLERQCMELRGYTRVR